MYLKRSKFRYLLFPPSSALCHYLEVLVILGLNIYLLSSTSQVCRIVNAYFNMASPVLGRVTESIKEYQLLYKGNYECLVSVI